MKNTKRLQTATFANGCFWCTEAVFKRVKGVVSVISGYAGGNVENPTYWDVAMKGTGHAESLQLQYDPKVISYDKLLDIFWATHDPTTSNRQGYDIGSEYRSIIFYHTHEQKKIAEASKERLDKSGKYKNPIVTEIVQFHNFYKAEDEHQNFYESGRRPDYCTVVIDPKIRKLLKDFKDEIKDEYK
jgi:peptide-methionine (S)-S-oxide reductase